MRIHIDSASLLSEAAKALRKSLASRGVRVPLSRAYEALAFALGHDSLYAMKHAKHGGAPDPLDHEAPAETVRERRRHQAARLKGFLGLGDEDAIAVVEEAQPSGNRRAPPSAKPGLPPELLNDLKSFLRDPVVYGRREAPHEPVVRQHVIRLLSASRSTPAANDPTMTVDGFLSLDLPCMRKVDRILHPERLAKGLPTDVIYEWKRRGADRPGWDFVREQLRQSFDAHAHHFGSYWDPVVRDLGTRVEAATGCPREEVENRVLGAGLGRQMADEVLEELRVGIGSRTLREMVALPRNQHGFHVWHPDIENENTFEAEFWQPARAHEAKPRDIRRFEMGIRDAKVTIEVTRERSHCDYEEGGAFVAFYFFLAKAVTDGRVVGLVRGELLIDRTRGEGMSNHEFYYDAESQPADLTHLAHIILTQHMSAEELFYPGDLLYLAHWEVVPELCGTGFAPALLRGVIDELRRRHKRLASIAYELRPAQFPHPFDRNLPIWAVRDYDRARERLGRYLDRLGVHDMVSCHGHSIAFDVTPDQQKLTDNERYIAHMNSAPPLPWG